MISHYRLIIKILILFLEIVDGESFLIFTRRFVTYIWWWCDRNVTKIRMTLIGKNYFPCLDFDCFTINFCCCVNDDNNVITSLCIINLWSTQWSMIMNSDNDIVFQMLSMHNYIDSFFHYYYYYHSNTKTLSIGHNHTGQVSHCIMLLWFFPLSDSIEQCVVHLISFLHYYVYLPRYISIQARYSIYSIYLI